MSSIECFRLDDDLALALRATSSRVTSHSSSWNSIRH